MESASRVEPADPVTYRAVQEQWVSSASHRPLTIKAAGGYFYTAVVIARLRYGFVATTEPD